MTCARYVCPRAVEAAGRLPGGQKLCSVLAGTLLRGLGGRGRIQFGAIDLGEGMRAASDVCAHSVSSELVIMSVPGEPYSQHREPQHAPFPPDHPNDETGDVDYDEMCDLYYLHRNKDGDRFFEDIPPDMAFVNRRGHVVKRLGPKSLNSEYPEMKSLKRVGYPIASGYWQIKIGGGGEGGGRGVMIHHLVYAAFGDMTL